MRLPGREREEAPHRQREEGGAEGDILLTRAVRRPTCGGRSFSNRPLARPRFREEQERPMATDTVKRVIAERGFGFIATEDGS
jgi:hypothetical protein